MKKDLSSKYTKNSVILENTTIRKTFKSTKKFNNEVRIYDTLKRFNKDSLAPKLYEIDYDKQMLTLEYCPNNRRLDINELLRFAHKFHSETRINSQSIYKSTDDYFDLWRLFLQTNVSGWKNTLTEVSSTIIKRIDICLNTALDRKFDICLIHRDIRNDNIGCRNSEYVIFDFELAMWGDPLWDCARILVDNACDEAQAHLISNLYNVDYQVIMAYKYLYASSFLVFLLEYQTDNQVEINKMLDYLLEEI